MSKRKLRRGRIYTAPVVFLLGLAVTRAFACDDVDNPAQHMVRATTQSVFGALDREPALKDDQRRLFELVRELVLPHFDFNLMSKRVLGKHWRNANTNERRGFVDAFRTLLVRTYATALLSYRGQGVCFLPTRVRGKSGRLVVRTTVETTGTAPISVDYAMRPEGEAWKVYDVTIEGVSLVITYRATFREEIRKQGLGGLIERLRKKNLHG